MTTCANIAVVVVGIVLFFACGLYVAGIADTQTEISAAHARCLKHATDGDDIKRCDFEY